MSLAALILMLRSMPGIVHKQDIAPVLARLNLGAASATQVGDDCAAIPDGDGFLLFAIEGFIPEFVAADPYFAGYCGVMVNLSDVAAMGGHALAVVDALFSESEADAAEVLRGLASAAARYGVPVVGGHTNTRASSGGLAVAVLGRAKTLLTSFDAQPGDQLIAAIDLRGRMRTPALYWDASTGADASRLRGDLALLPQIAEAGLCKAAKDISMAGIIGTALMLLEASKLGGVIDLDAIVRPAGVALEDWLRMFPSFGFLLSVTPANTETVIAMFTSRGIAACVIGETDGARIMRLRHRGEEQIFWELANEQFVGCVNDEVLHDA